MLELPWETRQVAVLGSQLKTQGCRSESGSGWCLDDGQKGEQRQE